ncbi:hypothetical protein TNCT_31301 [Trichonephila clavata]|uniref:Uncharacterized protein n=1 Tax=Trichonephila clavata TaxID=2740835 RepID=A0A8X6IZ67_TRICU|nr:hypothetical protein TNCT_31301 [Trichonephila clavata]
MAKSVKSLERKLSDIEKQLGGFIAFVDTFVEDDKEVLSFKLIQIERLNIKYESAKEEIFTSLSDGEFNNFDGKLPPAISILRNSRNTNDVSLPSSSRNTVFSKCFKARSCNSNFDLFSLGSSMPKESNSKDLIFYLNSSEENEQEENSLI